MSGQGSAEFREALEAFQRGELERARAVAEREIASGASPQLHHLLGLINCRQGDVPAGIEHFRIAVDAEPENAAFKVMLMRALIDAGRADEALEMPEPPAITSAAALALWRARAEAADAAGRPDVASNAWSRITVASPRDWRAWSNLGNALATRGQWIDAVQALDEAIRLNPAESAIQANAVAALLQAGRQYQGLLHFDEAEAAFRRAYELEPGNPSVVHRLGIALERTNRLDGLATLLDEALAAGVPEESLGYLRALLAWRTGRIAEARELLGDTDASGDPVAWNALKTKIADSLDDSETAFEAAEAMNRAAIDRAVRLEARVEWERNADRYREEQRQLARNITAEWAAKVPLLAEPTPRGIAFLLGFPRSGTTLLDTFLLGHPEIEVLEEKQLVAAAGQVTGRIEDLPNATVELVRKARDTYFAERNKYVGPSFTGVAVDKFPLDMGAAPLIQAMFPGAPMIFAQRHPCDVVLSGFLQPFGMVNFSDIRDAADYYDAMMSIWTASCDAMDLNVHTVVYEELVRDPEAVLRPLLDFLGLEWDERVLDHRRSARERGTIQTPSYDQVTEPLSTRPSGRWKRYRKQLEPVLPILLPWAERLGYSD